MILTKMGKQIPGPLTNKDLSEYGLTVREKVIAKGALDTPGKMPTCPSCHRRIDQALSNQSGTIVCSPGTPGFDLHQQAYLVHNKFRGEMGNAIPKRHDSKQQLLGSKGMLVSPQPHVSKTKLVLIPFLDALKVKEAKALHYVPEKTNGGAHIIRHSRCFTEFYENLAWNPAFVNQPALLIQGKLTPKQNNLVENRIPMREFKYLFDIMGIEQAIDMLRKTALAKLGVSK